MNILLYFISNILLTFMLSLHIFDEYFCPRYSQRAESYLFKIQSSWNDGLERLNSAHMQKCTHFHSKSSAEQKKLEIK